MAKISRDKGAAFERETAKWFRELGLDARRNVQETQLGNNGDVLVADFPVTIQCKVGVNPPIFPALDEAEAVGDPLGHLPIAVIRRNANKGRGRGRDCVVLRTKDFLTILRCLLAHQVDLREAMELEKLL